MSKLSKRIIMVVLAVAMFFGNCTSVAMAAATNDTEYNYSVFQADVIYEVTGNERALDNGSIISSVVSVRSKTGTIFFIEGNLFVTAAHVLQGEDNKTVDRVKTRLQFAKEDGCEYYMDTWLNVAYVDTANDIAILYGNKYSKKYCKPLHVDYTQTTSKDNMYRTCGYAGINNAFTISAGLFEWYGRISGSSYDALSMYKCEYISSNRLVFKADAISGMSGGPVFNDEGNVVAVLTESLTYTDSKFASAVHVSYLKTIIENLRIQEKAAKDAKALVKPAA